MSDIIRLKIIGWEKYNARKDVKVPSWFRFAHGLFGDSQFYHFTHEELCFWIYLLCEASKKSSEEVVVNLLHAEKIGRISKSAVKTAISKLEELEIVQVHGTRPVRGRNVRGTHTGATLHNNTLHNKIHTSSGKQKTFAANAAGVSANAFATLSKIWNENCGSLPKVKASTEKRDRAARTRWGADPDPLYWKQVVERIAGSDFCTGVSSRGWIANFDFLLRPDTHVKVMEGSYDGVDGPKIGLDWSSINLSDAPEKEDLDDRS